MPGMTGFDYAVLAILGISVLIGLLRGAVREMLALGAWVAAFIVANGFSAEGARLLPASLESPALRLIAAFVVLFLGTLLIVSLVRALLSELVKLAGLGAADRILGMLVGLVRGTVIVLVLVLAAGLTALPRQPEWRNAVSSRWFELLAGSVKPWLPADLARRIQFRELEPGKG